MADVTTEQILAAMQMQGNAPGPYGNMYKRQRQNQPSGPQGTWGDVYDTLPAIAYEMHPAVMGTRAVKGMGNILQGQGSSQDALDTAAILPFGIGAKVGKVFGKAGKAGKSAPKGTPEELTQFINSQFPRGDGRRPPQPMRPDGTPIEGTDFDPAAVKAEFDRQLDLRNTDRAYQQPAPQSPDFMMSADREAVDQHRSAVNRNKAISEIGPGPEVPSAPQVPPQVPGSSPYGPSGHGSGGGRQPDAVSPAISSSPVPRGQKYTQQHSDTSYDAFATASKEMAEGSQKLVIPSARDPSYKSVVNKILETMGKEHANRGLPAVGTGNMEGRVRRTLKLLRDAQKAGGDISQPAIMSSAFGKKGTLSIATAPFVLEALQGGGEVDAFTRALEDFDSVQ